MDVRLIVSSKRKLPTFLGLIPGKKHNYLKRVPGRCYACFPICFQVHLEIESKGLHTIRILVQFGNTVASEFQNLSKAEQFYFWLKCSAVDSTTKLGRLL